MPVVLLCHCDGTNGSTTFTDTAGFNRVLIPTSTTVTTASPKFGTGSADFTAAASSNITAGYSPDFNFGAGQFTVEAWAYFTSSPAGGSVYGVLSQFGASNLGWFLGMVLGNLAFYYSTTGADNPNVGAAYTPTLNTWIHLAADRDASNVLRVYANGAIIASATVSATIFASPLSCLIGNDGNLTRNFPGHLDEARITQGAAQYGGAFTAPSSPFSDPGNQIGTTYTSWSPADKTITAGLTGNNLVAALATSSQGVRSVDSHTTGKYYFEITGTTWSGASSVMGIANATAALGSVGATATNAALLNSGGATIVNGSSPGVSFGARANGDIIGIAVDLTSALLWFRVAPSGNWNANAGFSPGGTGGINISALGGAGTALLPIVATNASVSTFTANFGDTAFSGAVPTGFTSGWVIGAGVISAQARAMVLA